MLKVKSNEQGVCPFCDNNGVLDYEPTEFQGDMCFFRWKCANCGHEGEEWYSMCFEGHNVYDEKGNCVEVNDNIIDYESEDE